MKEGLRQTGRTTQILQKAIKLIGVVESVSIVFHTLHMAQYAKDMFLKLIVDKQPDRIFYDSVILNGTKFHFISQFHSSTYITGHIDHAVFYDHVVKGEL